MKLVSATSACVLQGAGATFAPNTFFSIGFARIRAKVPAARAGGCPFVRQNLPECPMFSLIITYTKVSKKT